VCSRSRTAPGSDGGHGLIEIAAGIGRPQRDPGIPVMTADADLEAAVDHAGHFKSEHLTSQDAMFDNRFNTMGAQEVRVRVKYARGRHL
jgi:hypothetical protein